jgi:hypothetical protein
MLLDEDNELEAITAALIEQEPDGSLLLAEIDIGEDAAQFAKSQLGRYIIGRINGEIEQFTTTLKRTFPLRWRRITQLQNEIYKREALKVYLLEAIQSGRSALAELSKRQGEVNG